MKFPHRWHVHEQQINFTKIHEKLGFKKKSPIITQELLSVKQGQQNHSFCLD